MALRNLLDEQVGSPLSAGGWTISLGAMTLVGVVLGTMAARYPSELQGLIVVPLLIWGLVRAMRRSFEGNPQRAYLLQITEWGLVLRGAFVGVHLVVGLWFYGGGIDFVGAQDLASGLLGQVLDGSITFESLGTGQHGGLLGLGVGTLFTMALLTVIAVVTGPNLFAMFGGCVVLGMAGALLFLRAFQRAFPRAVGERFLAAALFLLPSVSFWSIFLGKDALAFFLMGSATYCLARLLQGPRFWSLVGLGVSLGLLLGVRPHMGIALGLGVAMALAWRPLRLTGPVVWLGPVMRLLLLVPIGVLAVAVGTTGLVGLGVQAVTVESLADLAYQQHLGFVTTEAASALPLAIESAEPAAVARFIPLGVATLLFRPFPWEAHNALAVVASLENMVLAGLILWRRRALLASLRSLHRQPFMLHTLIVFVVGSIALSFSWQLGVMARFRTMVLPYLLILLAGAEPRDAAERS
jgi:hypothetical protein